MKVVTGALGLAARCVIVVGVVVVVGARPAAASNALDSPEGGVDQVARGGAWLARADDPMATYYNPAAIVRHPNGVHLGAQLLIRSHCFDRRDIDGNPVAPRPGFAPPPDPICADAPPFPNPQLGATFRIHRQFAIGLAVLAPHTNANVEWSPTTTYANRFGVEGPQPSPTRYMLIESSPLLVLPTLSLAYAPLKELSFGAGFVWGINDFTLSNTAEALSSVRCADPNAPCPAPGNPQPDDFQDDIFSRLSGGDRFVPGFVASVLYSPSRRFDIAAWYRFSDAVRSRVDLEALAPYYAPSGDLNPDPAVTDIEDAGSFSLPIPMEARLGFRYRHPRRGAKSQSWVSRHRGWARDAFSQDLFDVEVDLTWAHNSQIDQVEILLDEAFNINGTTGRVPQDASVPHPYRDVFGVRLGGEYVPIPDLLALRLGGFFESRGVSAEDVYIDFHLGERVGVAGGVAARLGAVDIALSYQHTFFLPLDNGGRGRNFALSGGSDRGDDRSLQAINGGRATSSLNEVGLGVTYHYFLPTL
ncbi:MAG: hypothetical protein AAGN82_00645 [Myxococcota bacterium]